MCQTDEEELLTKRTEALQAGCVAVFSCLVLLSVIQYRTGSISIEKREWDLQTVTASDYTLEIEFTDEQVLQIRRDIYANSFEVGKPHGYQFKMWVIKVVEEELNRLSNGQGGKVGDIQFTYHNSWVIDLLYERGEAIKWQDWEKLNNINKKLTERCQKEAVDAENKVYYLRDADMYNYNLTDPISAFISIETEEAYNLLATRDPPELEIGGATSEIEEALEPTNIIWENYDMSWTIRALYLANIIFVTCVVLGVTFLVSFKAKDEEQDLIGIYDNSITCTEVNKIYSYDELSKLAADEWVDYYKNGGEDMERQISENLACFCTAEYMRVGDDAAANVYLTTDGSQKVQTCAEFFDSKGKVVLIKMLVSFLIVGVNFALREILISMIKGMRLRTVTQETNYTMVGIFVGQFVNTALLLLFNSANFKDIDGGVGPLSAVFLVGDRTDFDVKWYSTVGAILMKTMFMVAIWPLIEFGMFYTLMNFNRLLDREWGSDTFVTNTPTVQAYIDLYAGPEYLIHYRYATILLNIGVAFFYGTAMPYLYATALLAFVVLYINERLLVCYYYREPPAFDEKMTLMTLELSKYVPLMMLPVAFWQLGNRQIFDNQVEEIVYKSDPIMSGHSI